MSRDTWADGHHDRRIDSDGTRHVLEDDDTYGWIACDKPWCDLHVVRPGKVQCNGEHRGGCGHDEVAS